MPEIIPEQIIDEKTILEMLKTDKATLQEFENRYKNSVLANTVPTDFFEVNAKDMANHKVAVSDTDYNFKNRIVNEFLDETVIYKYDRTLNQDTVIHRLSDPDLKPVTKQELWSLPKNKQPQATSIYQMRDIDILSYPMLLMMYQKSLDNHSSERVKKQAYDIFRQGLDTLNIDPITYQIIDTNPASMGHWLPKLVHATTQQDFFKIPSTTVIKVPMNILQLTRCEYNNLTRETLDIVDEYCKNVFELKPDGDYFIKTGTYSSKFDFRNCRVTSAKEINELGEYLLFIHHQALAMAGNLNVTADNKPAPAIYGVSTTTEWCVREYIKDTEENPCIYKGLPLHTEYRAFIDCDDDIVMKIVPYWESETMKKAFSKQDSVHKMHDYLIYCAHEQTLMNRYNAHVDEITKYLNKMLPDIHLSGQWSLDIMQNGNDFWLIDMAPAQRSAFYNQVPEYYKKPLNENWLPDLTKKLTFEP